MIYREDKKKYIASHVVWGIAFAESCMEIYAIYLHAWGGVF